MNKLFIVYIFISILAANIYFIFSIIVKKIKYKKEVFAITQNISSLTKIFFNENEITKEKLKLCREYIVENLKEGSIAFKFKTLSLNMNQDKKIEIAFVLRDSF